MARANKRFTIYDMLEEKGEFEKNPANADSRTQDGTSLYKGPQQYPQMFYHPTGERKIIVPAEIIVTPMGPKMVGEQSELVWKIAENESEANELRAAGWHDHPSLATVAGGGKAPPVSAQQRIAELEAQAARDKKELESLRAATPILNPAKPTAGGGISSLKDL